MKYYIKTFGCQMNEHDSELIAGSLDATGYTRVFSMEEANIIIANTCCIRESAENKIWGFIGNIKNYKYQNPHVILVICGCMTQQENILEAFKKRGKHIDIVLGTYQQHLLPAYISDILNGSKQIIDISEDSQGFPDTLPVTRTNAFQAQVNIIYGCNNFCAYCIVPYVRGRERSRSFEAVVAEVRELAAAGYKEITLLGQNVNSYGKDFTPGRDGTKPDFAQLLVALHNIEGIERIRYMTSHPRDFSLDLVDTIAGLPKVCPQFHLPLQAGCNKTLKQMNRGYDTETYRKLLERIREKLPESAVTSDIIVGFPGETDADFAEGLQFIKDCNFDAAYTFLYSKRSGTPAATRAEQVPEAIKKARLQQLLEAQNLISLQINKRLIGKEIKVLVEGVSKTSANTYTGRTDTNKIVVFPGSEDLVGQIVTVGINSVKTWHLEGEIIKAEQE